MIYLILISKLLEEFFNLDEYLIFFFLIKSFIHSLNVLETFPEYPNVSYNFLLINHYYLMFLK